MNKAYLFNFGSIFTYIGWGVLLFHLSYVYSTKNPAHFSVTFYALSSALNGILSLPYSWDKFSLRIKCFIQIIVYTILTLGYLYTWIIFKS